MPKYIDFRFIYPSLFVLVNCLSLISYNGWDNNFIPMYAVLSFIFFLSFWIGAGLLKLPCSQSSVCLSKRHFKIAVILFFLSQLYYVKYLYLFLTSSISNFESYRFELENQVNLYMGQFAYVFLLLSMSYIIVVLVNNIRFYMDFRHCKKYCLFFTVIFFFVLSITELALRGSRSTVFSLLFVVGMVLIRLNILKTRVIILSAFICFFLVGYSSYMRIATNPASLEWWIAQNIIEPDSSPFVISIRMIWRTFFGIGERTVVLIDALLNGEIPYQYGYDTFFYFVSILPGKQMNPSIWLNHNVFYGSDQDVGYPPTIIGQMLWDFGIIGIPVMGFVIGLLGMWLFRKAHSSSIVWSVAYALYLEQCLLSLYGEFRLGWLIANVIMLVATDYFIRGKVHFGRKLSARYIHLVGVSKHRQVDG